LKISIAGKYIIIIAVWVHLNNRNDKDVHIKIIPGLIGETITVI